MRFEIYGLEPNHPDVIKFRNDWLVLIVEENRLVNGMEDDGRVSTVQMLTVNLYTGQDREYKITDFYKMDGDEFVFCTARAPQAELEALVRARSRALSNLLNVVASSHAAVKPNG